MADTNEKALTVLEKDGVEQLLARANDSKADFQAVLSMIPSYFGVSEKATYLAFRALGLKPALACEATGITTEQLEVLQQDHHFRDFELKHLGRMQRQLGPEIVRFQFLRNYALLLTKDARLFKKYDDVDELSSREFNYLMKARSQYNPQELLSMDKIISPEKHQEKVVINLTWDSAAQAIEADGLIEGEYKEVE